MTLVHSARLVATVVATTLAVVGTGLSASAGDPDADADRTAEAIEAVAPGGVPVAPEVVASGDLVAETTAGTVAAPIDGSGGITFTSTDGVVPVTIGMPDEADGAPARVADDGTIVYQGTGPVDVAVQAMDDGVRLQTVLADSSAPLEYVYTFEGTEPVLNADGSVTLTVPGDGYSIRVGEIDAPWAFDATGAPIPSRYRIEGSTVVQEVEHRASGTRYPVVADPRYKGDCGIVTCTLSFDRATTRNMRDGLNITAIATGVVGAIAGLTGIGVPITVLTAVIAGKLAIDAVYAARYYENGNCFAYLFPKAPVFGIASFWPKEIRRGTRNCA